MQAERDLEQASASREDQRHLVEKAKVLDNFYVGTRYPNGHPEGPPFEHYGEIQSGEAILYASEILAYVRAQMA
jgi:HEPN domain-containing protein